MSFAIDNFGKVTISFGGVCPLKCIHCYTVPTQFVHSRFRKIKEVIDELHLLDEKFNTICISGDTDPFLFPDKTLELLKILVKEFPLTDIMITSRLIPSTSIIDGIVEIGNLMAKAKRFLIPGISVVTYSYPNGIENPKLVPSSIERFEMLRKFSEGGLPCFLAMRPTFPFSVVPKEEVEKIVQASAPFTAVYLGEAFIMDGNNEIACNIGMEPMNREREDYSPMTFLSQPTLWGKRIYSDEIVFAENLCMSYNRPFFMRSMSGLKFIKNHWDPELKRIIMNKDEEIDKSLEGFLP